MTEAFDSIKKGLKEALAHGEDVGAVVHEVQVSEPDVAAIRAKSGLSQREFARSIGVAVGTLQGWEQGRRRPEGQARVLLALIEKRPAIVQEELRGS
ncbi:MAG: helix-turn-helix domain-containing protein [Alphaproteobacteria bacterium GM202ARS2]|nr:helix-turn-helix domain-containing protein [Alphaproteobacteria bacterium GM202ARS2]